MITQRFLFWLGIFIMILYTTMMLIMMRYPYYVQIDDDWFEISQLNMAYTTIFTGMGLIIILIGYLEKGDRNGIS